jgi:hypothetical protein
MNCLNLQILLGGVGGNRTRVQTYSPKAFYMFIYALICRDLAGAQQTNLVLIRLSFNAHSQKP